MSREIGDHFAPVAVNLKQSREESREIFRAVRPAWAPLLVFLDRAGLELYRLLGWVDPAEMLATLRLIRGVRAHVRGELAEALALFREAAALGDGREIGAEALFRAGAVAYRLEGGDLDVLEAVWQELRDRHPGSVWASRASVIDDRER